MGIVSGRRPGRRFRVSSFTGGRPAGVVDAQGPEAPPSWLAANRGRLPERTHHSRMGRPYSAHGRVEAIASLSPPAIEGVSVERGVVVGGLMICGSFLLAALLNRSAMEETPAAPPAVPVSAAPKAPAAAEAGNLSRPNECIPPQRPSEAPAESPTPVHCPEPE